MQKKEGRDALRPAVVRPEAGDAAKVHQPGGLSGAEAKTIVDVAMREWGGGNIRYQTSFFFQLNSSWKTVNTAMVYPPREALGA